jgi:hypothetical protein
VVEQSATYEVMAVAMVAGKSSLVDGHQVRRGWSRGATDGFDLKPHAALE